MKYLPANAKRHRRHRFDPWVGKTPWRRKGQRQPTAVILPGKSHAQRSLVGYSPWGHKGLDMTEQLSAHTHLNQIMDEDLLYDTGALLKALW